MIASSEQRAARKQQAASSKQQAVVRARGLGLLLAASCSLLAVPSWAATQTDTCVECHTATEGDARGPAHVFAEDVHFQRGLSCADCHGGDRTATDPEQAMNRAKGFLGKPAHNDIPQFCARCHADPAFMRKYNPNLPTDQYAKYLTSQHGKHNLAGDLDTAVCTSCHEAHGIRSKKDPLSPVFATNIPGTCANCHNDAALMERHGLKVTQYAEYAQSVHGQALIFRGDRAAPHCASCHGSHEAAKPGTSAVGNVCAQCHSLTRDLFATSVHKLAHERLGMPECEVCHGNHLIQKPGDEMLGTGAGALCVKCHEPGSAGYAAAQHMRELIEQAKTQMTNAEAAVTTAQHLGMDVSEGEFELNEAKTKLTQTRTYIHSFAVERMQPIADESMAHAKQALARGQQAIHGFQFRRRGLWMTLGILIVLAGGLLLMIRELERTPPRNTPHDRKPPA